MLDTLKTNLQEARNKLVDLKQTQLPAAIRKAVNPDDADIVRIEQEIDKTSATIRRLEQMVEAGQVAASDDAVQARRQEILTSAETAKKLAKARVDVAAQLDATLAQVGTLLRQYDEIGREVQHHTVNVHGTDREEAWNYSLIDLAAGRNGLMVGAMQEAVFKSGIGQIGIFIEGLDPRRPIGEPTTLKEAAEENARALEIRLNGSVARQRV